MQRTKPAAKKEDISGDLLSYLCRMTDPFMGVADDIKEDNAVQAAMASRQQGALKTPKVN